MSFGLHSAVHPFGPQAARIAAVWWLMFWVSAAVFVLVVAFLLGAVFRSPSSRERSAARGGGQKRMGAVVGGAAIATAVILVGFLVVDVSAGRALATAPAPPPLSIQVVGHQWWWEVHYPDPVASQAITTANEIHIPIGRPVEFDLASRDVIHSFWAPSLHGKKDLIPGHGSRLLVQADQPGTFHGQCAEFCGLQHANMGFLVVAQPEDEFQAWQAAQRQPAPVPADAVLARGQQVFLSVPCAMCHSVQGTPAWGQNGPDLTHVASRRLLAAGTMANTSENMSRWIADPHHLKPGTKMPPTALEPSDLQALTAYMESLK